MIKIISRKSDLAVIQAEIVANALKQADKDISVSFIKKETEGDIDQLTSSFGLSIASTTLFHSVRSALGKSKLNFLITISSRFC